MIIDNNIIRPSNPENLLRRLYDKQVVGREYWLGYIYYRDGKKLSEPYLEIPSDFEEITIEQLKNEYNSRYSIRVEELIREKYTISDELALQRQRNTKCEEFQEYFNYCEECKEQAREEILGPWVNQINESSDE